ncbi:MAG: G5 domain-containing protein [Patescibacteria group bacterium]
MLRTKRPLVVLTLGIFLTSLGTLGWLIFWSTPATAQPSSDPAVAAKEEEIVYSQEKFSADSQAGSLSAAFRQANKEYYPEDKVVAFPDPALGLGTVVTVTRALPVVVNDGRNQLVVRSWQKTVGGLLQEKHFELGVDDRVTPSLTSALGPESVITITRINRTEVTQTEKIAFQTVERGDPETYRPGRKIVTEGRNGVREKKYLLIRQDEKLVSKTLIASTVINQPVSQVIKVGTKLKIGRVVTGRATWYDCCGTQVATDAFRRGTEIRVTNIANNRSIIVGVDGCICGNRLDLVVDLHPSLFTQLGGTLGQGVFSSVRVEEVLN